MSVTDTQLMIASRETSNAAISHEAFSEGSETAPWVTRIQFDDFSERSGVISGQDRDEAPIFSGTLRDFTALIPCFTAQSAIATKTGLMRIDEVQPGQLVMTRDNGLQSVRWIGKRSFGWRALGLNPKLRAIRIAAGALGAGLPARYMTVSPNHRILVLEHGDERLVPAADLLHIAGVTRVEAPEVSYYQLLCDRHELLLVDDCWSESYRATTSGLAALEDAARMELAQYLPDLATGGGNYTAVRADQIAFGAMIA